MNRLPLPAVPPLAAAAVVLAAAAGWAGTTPATGRIPRLGDAGGRSDADLARRGGLPRVFGAAGGFVAALAAVAAIVLAASGSVPAALLVLVAGAVLARHRRAVRRSREDAIRRAAVLEICTVLVAELRAGRAPRDALGWAAGAGGPAGSSPAGSSGTGSGPGGSGAGHFGGQGAHPGTDAELAGGLLAALRYDRDVPAVLRELGTRPGAHGFRRLAACWQVAESSGAGLAGAVERLANGLRAEEAQRREVAGQLAAPRATARLLAVLPLFGLLLAAGLGGNPLDVLLGTSYGLLCLTLGVVLDIAGVLWTERIAAAAERVS